MKRILISGCIAALFMLGSCGRSIHQTSSERTQETNHVVDRTDYDKMQLNHKNKDKVEEKRKERYHSAADKTDKKLNHQDRTQQINQRKGWDGSFGLY